MAAGSAALHVGRSDARAATGDAAISADPADAEPAAARVDYLTLAAGAIPVSVGGSGARLGTSFEKAIRAVDGDPTGFGLLLKPGPADTDTEFVYELPARGLRPLRGTNVLETPSPSATFTRHVELLGSAVGPDAGFTTLASATLATHRSRGEVTEILPSARPVRPVGEGPPRRWHRAGSARDVPRVLRDHRQRPPRPRPRRIASPARGRDAACRSGWRRTDRW